MALFSAGNVKQWLHLPMDTAQEVASGLNEKKAEREARQVVGNDDYDDIESGKSPGDDEYDRLAQAEVLFAFASYIGNRGGIRVDSGKGGLVEDFGIVNQQQTVRKLLSQGQVEQVQGRLRQQAEDVLDDLISANAYVWGV